MKIGGDSLIGGMLRITGKITDIEQIGMDLIGLQYDIGQRGIIQDQHSLLVFGLVGSSLAAGETFICPDRCKGGKGTRTALNDQKDHQKHRQNRKEFAVRDPGQQRFLTKQSMKISQKVNIADHDKKYKTVIHNSYCSGRARGIHGVIGRAGGGAKKAIGVSDDQNRKSEAEAAAFINQPKYRSQNKQRDDKPQAGPSGQKRDSLAQRFVNCEFGRNFPQPILPDTVAGSKGADQKTDDQGKSREAKKKC